MSEGRTIAKNTAVVGFFTGFSRILGFVRDVIMASMFGTGLASSAFALAWRLPNLFRAVLGEGALSAAFIPVVSEALGESGQEEADKLASRIFIMIGSVLMCIVGLGLIVLLLLKKQDLGESWNAAVSISFVTFPYVIFICLAALCMGLFHTRGKFLVPAVSQSFLNILWIGALLFLCPRFGDSPMEQIFGVAWGVIAAGLAQLCFQFYFLYRSGFRLRLNLKIYTPRVRRFLRLMTPVFLGTGITQLNVFISGLLAMFAGAWAPAAFTFAERIVYAALGPLGTALGTVLLPTYSRMVAEKRHTEMMSTLSSSIRAIALLMMPFAAALYALSLPCVILVFQRGLFDGESSILVSRALQVMAPGLVVFSIYKVVLPAFYAIQNTRTPVYVALGGTAIGLVLNVLSVWLLPDGYQHMGLAGSVVISSFFNAAVLLLILNTKLGGLQMARTSWSLGATLVSGCVMAVVCGRTYSVLSSSDMAWAAGAGLLSQLLRISAAGLVGLSVYIVLRMIVDYRETSATFAMIMRRFRKKP